VWANKRASVLKKMFVCSFKKNIGVLIKASGEYSGGFFFAGS